MQSRVLNPDHFGWVRGVTATSPASYITFRAVQTFPPAFVCFRDRMFPVSGLGGAPKQYVDLQVQHCATTTPT